MKKLLAGLFVLSALAGQSQLHLYSVSAFSGTFDTLTTGTRDTTIEVDDEVSGDINIGFNFTYDSVVYSKIRACSNGWITFDTNATSFTTSTMINDLDLSSQGIRPLIGPLWDDISLAHSTSKFSYATTGTSPNRVFTAEWINCLWDYSATTPAMSFQVKLFEGSNKIQFIYRRESGSMLFPSASIGLAAENTGSDEFISLTNASTSPGFSTSIETSNISSKPATGQIYEFAPPQSRDASLPEFISGACGGTSGVVVVLKNQGLDTLSSVDIDWAVATNAGAYVGQTQVNWTGSLLNGDTAHVTLGTFSFSSGNTYDIEAYSSNPNSQSDQNTANDTLRALNSSIAMTGTYTIGGTNPDYATLGAAITDLNTIGVCGPVVFEVYDTTYNEQMDFGSISGTNGNNTVTFKAAPGSVNRPRIWFSPGFTAHYVANFNNASNIILDSLMIENTNNIYGRVINIMASTQYITIRNCELRGAVVSNTSSFSAVVYNETGTGHLSNNITIEDNEIKNGSYGIYMYGGSTISLETDNIIRGNDITGWYYMGVASYYQEGSEIENNFLENGGLYSSPRGIYAFYSDKVTINANELLVGGSGTGSPFGIYAYYCDGDSVDVTLISNNMVAMHEPNVTGSVYGIYAYRGTYNRIVYNSIGIQGGGTQARGLFFNYNLNTQHAVMKNNTVANYNTGYAVYAGSYFGVDSADYNNYYTNGSFLGYWGGNRSNLSQYIALSGKESNSMSNDPQYLSATNMRSRSVDLNNAGTPLTYVTEDFAGNTRSTTTPDIGASEYTPPATDISIVQVMAGDLSSCGVTNETISVEVKNSGTQTTSNIPVAIEITGAVTASFADTITTSIASGATDTVVFSSFNTRAGGILDFKAYSYLGTDSFPDNDTLEASSNTISAIPTTPPVSNQAICLGRDTFMTSGGVYDEVEWFAGPAGGAPLSVGDTFSLNGLSSTDTFYVEAFDMIGAAAGPANNLFGFGGTYTNFVDGMVFDVNTPLTIDSVTVYVGSTGNVIVNLTNNIGTILQSDTTLITNAIGPQKLEVGFTIFPGSNYRLHAGGSSVSNLYRNSSGATFPQTDPGGNIEIHSAINGLHTSGYWYFFYDWKITYEGCHSDRKEVEVAVNPIPTVNLGNDTGFCAGTGFSHTLNASNSNSVYVWQDNSTNATLNVTTAGTYSVTVTNNFSCTIADTLVVGQFNKPTASLGSLSDVCESDPTYNLVAGSGSPGGGIGYYLGPGALGDSLFSPGAAGDGTHTIQYVYESGPGCSDTASQSITVMPAPEASVPDWGNLCANSSPLTLSGGTGTPAGGTGVYFGPGVSGTTFNPIALGVGTYNIGYIYTGPNGCVDTAIHVMNVDTLPLVSLGLIPATCENAGPTVMTSGIPLGGIYTGPGFSNDTLYPDVAGQGTHSTQYIFTDNNGCSGTATGSFRVHPGPSVDIGEDTIICEGAFLTLEAGLGFVDYDWSIGVGGSSISVTQAGTYSVTVTDINGCTAVDSMEVVVDPCNGMGELFLGDLHVWPNPTNGKINLEFTGIPKGSLDVMELSGKVVMTIENLKQADELDLSHLAKGTYIVRLTSSEATESKRIQLIK